MSWLGLLRTPDRRAETDWPRVLSTLRSFACPACGELRGWRASGRLVRRLNSYTGFAVCRGCDERVFVKQIRRYPRIDPVERASREFRNADALYRAMPEDEHTAVTRPLAAIDGVLVFDYVPGIPLDRALRGKSHERRKRLLATAGAWFARLHSSVDASPYGDPELSSRLEYLRQRCVSASRLYPSISRALELQQRRMASIADRSFPLVLVHGDAKPGNFLLSGDRVVAVDVEYRMRGLAEMDLAQFLVQMRVARSPFPTVPPVHRESSEAAFLAGYSRLRSFDPQVLSWVEMYFTLALWMSDRNRGGLWRIRADRLFRPELERLFESAGPEGAHPMAAPG